jgi:glycosyltransferase involved in cell wall biosynthesis
MPAKIGLFDPGFDFFGHWIAFNGYIAELVGDDFEVVFLDFGGRMRSVYEGKLHLKYPPSFINVAGAPSQSATFSFASFFNIFWWRKRISDLFWYRKAFRNIEKLNLDLVLINSQRGPLIYLEKPQFPYATNAGAPTLIEARERLKGPYLLFAPVYNFFIRRYFAFFKRAEFLFTTHEPTIPSPFKDLVWLPLALRDFKPEQTRAKRKFLTVGTVSDSKNHLFAIDAFEKFDLRFPYLIAGKVLDKTGEEVQRRVEHSSNPSLMGAFKNLPMEEYDSLIGESDFMIIPYDLARGGRNSQVLYDSFRGLTPGIAPDCQPFRMYADKYGVVLLYEKGDERSFSETIKKAAALSKNDFLPNFKKLYDDFSPEEIQKKFLAPIRLSVNRRKGL